MQSTVQVSLEAIKVHPRQSEFFDDIKGSDYETFKESIKDEGVLTPLIVSLDMTLLSGHQRLKAAQDLELDSVPVIVREDVASEEEKLTLLLVSNFGRQKNDDEKQRKIAVEYVKLKGNKHGTNRHSKNSDNRNSKLTQEEIARELGVSVSTLNEMLQIERNLTPEVKDLLNKGAFTKTTAAKILVKLSYDEQKELFEVYGKKIIEGVTQKQMEEFSELIKKKDNEIKMIKSKNKINSDKNTNGFDIDKEQLIEEQLKLKHDLRQQYEDNQKYEKEVYSLKEKNNEMLHIIEELKNSTADRPDCVCVNENDTFTVDRLIQTARSLNNEIEFFVEDEYELKEVSIEEKDNCIKCLKQVNDLYKQIQKVFKKQDCINTSCKCITKYNTERGQSPHV